MGYSNSITIKNLINEEKKDLQVGNLKQYLVAKIKEEKFAFNITNIEQIVRDMKITKIPHKYNFLEGVINVRNNVIPLINLKQKLFSSNELAKDYVIIIANFGDGYSVGLIVDEIIEVITIADELIDNPIFFANNLEDQLVSGVGKLESGLVIILNILNILSEEDKGKIESIIKKVEEKSGSKN